MSASFSVASTHALSVGNAMVVSGLMSLAKSYDVGYSSTSNGALLDVAVVSWVDANVSACRIAANVAAKPCTPGTHLILSSTRSHGAANSCRILCPRSPMSLRSSCLLTGLQTLTIGVSLSTVEPIHTPKVPPKNFSCGPLLAMEGAGPDMLYTGQPTEAAPSNLPFTKRSAEAE